ncbi:MAG: response regulator transcription factor [Chloroflexota bacterium]
MTQIRVVMIDDHGVLLDGLKLLLSLEGDIEVVGYASTGATGVEVAEREHPHVVVTDVRLPDIDGIEVTRRLRQSIPESRVLILTAHDDDHYVYTLLQAGASGYVLKNAAGADLVRAIRTIASGKPWLQPEIARRLMQQGAEGARRAPKTGMDALIEPLTAREIDVLRLLAGAASNREIADSLMISTRTVETHLANIYGKLAVRGRTEAMLWAIHEDILVDHKPTS